MLYGFSSSRNAKARLAKWAVGLSFTALALTFASAHRVVAEAAKPAASPPSTSSTSSSAHKNPTAILVDKKTNSLQLCEYVDGAYKILKTYHATMGQVKGDKEDEGDLKTPEGIYTFKTRMTAPKLAKKFGSLAFYMNFPNTFDELAGHKGSNIMLHATDTPERLKKSYDSLGCVVVNDQEIHEIAPHVRVGLTPILIFPELTDEYLKPGQDEAPHVLRQLDQGLGVQGYRCLHRALPLGLRG